MSAFVYSGRVQDIEVEHSMDKEQALFSWMTLLVLAQKPV